MPVAALGHARHLYLFAVRPAYADRAGRVDLLVGHGGWLAFASDADRHAWHSIGGEVVGTRHVTLRLASAPRLRARVVDERGQPVRGAQLSFSRGRTPGGDDRPEAGVLSQLDMLFMAFAPARESGADGMLEIPVLREDGLPWSVTFHAGKLQSDEVLIAPNAAPIEVVVR